MVRETFDDKNQKRRKNSMLKNSFGKLKYLFVLAFLLVVPIKAWGGAVTGEDVVDTDNASFALFSFFDLRDRESFVQVTNTSGSNVFIHVQIWNVPAGCDELDFYDLYTPGDTHVYNLRNIVANTPAFNPSISLPGGAYGLVTVTTVTGDGGPITQNFALIGNFRVIDNAGYEYRTNSAGVQFFDTLGSYTLNFSNVGGANRSDVVGVAVDQVGEGFAKLNLVGTQYTFEANIFNDAERRVSCGNFTFACAPNQFDVGINNVFPASREAPAVCAGNSDSRGFLRLDIINEVGVFADVFTGFIGLNNGDGTGSMDSWWQSGVPAPQILGPGGGASE